MQKFLKPWWAILLQGLLFVILSFLIFNNSETVLLTLSFYLGLLVLISGVAGIIFYLSTKPEQRKMSSLIVSIVILVIGVLMVTKIVATMKAVTVLFGVLAIVIGFNIALGSYNLRKIWNVWWLPTIIGIAAIFAGIQSIMNMDQGAEAISFIIGISVFLCGVGSIIMAILKRKVEFTQSEN